MNDADELARRYLGLWAEYVTALLADPRALETLKRWIAFTGQFAYPAPGKAGGEGTEPPPAWPPIFGPFGPLPMGPAALGPSTIDSNSGPVGELARRIDALERRLTVLERQLKPPRPRRKARVAE